MNAGLKSAWVPILAVVAVLVADVGLALYLRVYSPSYLRYWFPFPFFPLLFVPVVFLFFGLGWFFFWGGRGWRRGWCGWHYDPALETLRERFARGEITKEQLDDMVKTLREKEGE